MKLTTIFIIGVFLFYWEQSASAVTTNWYVEGNVGYNQTKTPSIARVPTAFNMPDDSYQYSDIKSTPLYSFGFGHDWKWSNKWFSGIGLGVSLKHTHCNDKVVIHEYSIPQSDDYSFTYDTHTDALFLTLRSDIYQSSRWIWFIQSGIGYSYNEAANYKEHKSSGYHRNDLQFNNAMNREVSFMLGSGVGFKIIKNWKLTVRYEYINFGNVSLGLSKERARAGVKGMKTKLTSNVLLLGITYIF